MSMQQILNFIEVINDKRSNFSKFSQQSNDALSKIYTYTQIIYALTKTVIWRSYVRFLVKVYILSQNSKIGIVG